MTERQAFVPTNEQLARWLDKQTLLTIASHGSDGYPNAASVAFSQSADFHFVIITDKDSRKAHNIAGNNKVALTITNLDDRYTLQVQGNAQQMSWDEFAEYAEAHYRKLPFTLPFKDIPGQTPYVIEPVSMKFTDVNVRPWAITEIAL